MNHSPTQTARIATAWVVILSLSLFRIVMQEIFKISVSEGLEYTVSLLFVLAGLALTFLWPAIRPLRPFFGLFIVLLSAQFLAFTWIDQLPAIQRLLKNPSFAVSMLTELTLKLAITLVVIVFLFILKKDRHAFFLARGDLAAPTGPVKWLGIKPGERWNITGRNFAFFISLGTLAFLVIAARPPLDAVLMMLPLLPAVLLAAAMNAFYEEISYKASFLAVLEDVVGKPQALALMAAFFGIFHFYGIPYGVIGVALASFLGWFLGKSMLETRGLFWAWFIHFLQDVLIFAFLAIGMVTPGG
ncbi:MAG: CPBP family intramembrane metalloprotease [Anaerolineales bacterium]|nr:CPBP family intramembrane metalloprotease [Anaerolineales bacterium]